MSSPEASSRDTTGSPRRPETSSPSPLDALRQQVRALQQAERREERDHLRREADVLLDEVEAQQAALDTSCERFQELFDTAPTGYLVFDPEGRVETVNLTGVGQLAAAKEEIADRPFGPFLEPDYRPLFHHHLRLTIDKQVEQVVEVVLRPTHGPSFWARLQSVPFPGPDGTPRVRTAMINISEQKKLEQTLIAAREEALKTTQVQRAFLSSMSHEIRTPLTSVIGFADVLDELAADDQQKKIARLIKGSGRRLLSTLNSVLSYARLQEGEKDLDLEPQDVAAIARESVQLLQPLAGAQDVALSFTADGSDCTAPIHQEHLDRVLDNLIGNGLKYTDEGSVTVRVRTVDDRVEIDVEDTGVGIDESMQAMIFEPFFQVGAGLEATRDGIGLGLSITKQLVDSMGGTIRLDSQRGVGSCFTLAFPKAAPPADAPSSEDLPHPPVGAQPGRVLLVDDQDEIRDLVSLFLGDETDVRHVAGVDAAIEALHAESFDAVLADIQLEERQTGLELFHQIRNHAASRDIPVIAFTAYALPGDRERLERVGFDAYLAKPFTKGDLLQTLQAVTA